MSDPVAAARRITDALLLPAAAAVDAGRAPLKPQLDALAEAGLYGLAGPGGDQRTVWAVTEVLASGCLTTAFVWLQHQGALGRVARADDSPARRAWLAPLCDGSRRAGVAVSGVRPPAPTLRARRDGEGWLLDGVVPWVTGWGIVDILLTSAVSDDGQEVWTLVDPTPGATLRAEPLRLIAADASRTVRLTYASCPVPPGRVVRVAPYVPPPPTDGGGRANGSLALGVAGRACALMGPTPLDAELDARRAELDDAANADAANTDAPDSDAPDSDAPGNDAANANAADRDAPGNDAANADPPDRNAADSDAPDTDMASARAAAAELALRAAARLVVSSGGRAASAGSTASRLIREAAFTAVFGSRTAIRGALLERLDGPGPRGTLCGGANGDGGLTPPRSPGRRT